MAELDYSRHYLRWHSRSDEHFEKQSNGEFYGLKGYLPGDKSARILEFGCGMGFALAGVRRAGYVNAEGIDASSIQIAAGLARSLPVRLVSVEETMSFLAGRVGAYDFIYSMDVIEHIPVDLTVDVLTAIRKCLKPGGKFLCRTPNSDSPVATHMRYIDWTHLVSFSDASLDFVLHNAGFVRIEVGPTRDGRPSPRRIEAFTRWVLRRMMRAVYWLCLFAEFGRLDADRASLTPNIVGIGYAPPSNPQS